MFRTASCTLLLCILGFARSISQAAIIEGTDPRWPGTANTTIDTATGLEWLDWNLTTDISYDIVSSLLNDPIAPPAQRFQGYRFATQEEIGILFSHLGMPTADFPGFTGSVDEAVSENKAMSLLGPTFVSTMGGRNAWTRGMFSPAALAEVSTFNNYGVCPCGGTNGVTAWSGAADRWVGSALVRSVPEPNGLALLCVVAPAFVRLVRRRSSR